MIRLLFVLVFFLSAISIANASGYQNTASGSSKNLLKKLLTGNKSTVQEHKYHRSSYDAADEFLLKKKQARSRSSSSPSRSNQTSNTKQNKAAAKYNWGQTVYQSTGSSRKPSGIY